MGRLQNAAQRHKEEKWVDESCFTVRIMGVYEMSGKGSGRLHDRTKLSDEEMKKRWDAIFGKKDKQCTCDNDPTITCCLHPTKQLEALRKEVKE